MNVVTRGVKNTLRSPLRSGAIILMFAISIALIVSMLVARSSIEAKINEVKATAGTEITIRPAGTMGGMGGGEPLTASQLTTIKSASHVNSLEMNLTDELASTDTSLTSSLEFGNFGRGNRDTNSTDNTNQSSEPAMAVRTPGISVTGTTNVNSISTDGNNLNITSGEKIDASGNENIALIGTTLATKNSLKAGDTFTAYGNTITIKGIFTTDNRFQDSGIVMPLKTLQTLTQQTDVVSSVVATIDSSDNVSTTTASLKSSLGDDADITSDVQRAEQSITSLTGIANLALGGVIASAIAATVIILLAMIMVVRERRREIGVMKAIGGTDGKVVGQFIIEGLTLTAIGAIFGILLGVLVSGPMTTSLVTNQTASTATNSAGGAPDGMPDGGPGRFASEGIQQISNNLTQVSASLTPEIIITSILVTILIAVIGTALPAWFIAKVRPAEVLRSE